MKEGGIGGANTKTGLEFEGRTSLANLFSSTEGYSVDGDEIYFNGHKVATLFVKHGLYSKLLVPNGVDYKKIISKKLLPDSALLVKRTMYIIEMKFQKVSGSVDEKLQTCDFKYNQYSKLFSTLGIKVKYVYLLNDWFANQAYKDTLKYVKTSGCYYFFNRLPFKFLGLPEI